ncbi:Serine/threonine-protein kinase PknD [Rubripirellula amarantea]|uniref:Serine/threonine-protein kinase PknD n=1 Tax=Rubripirellula amarantea TaxID=2527999 RepID=A0A5C5WQV2_9BACT|nr:protein kinase [Rubripirellula amarantea]TWT52529.1 Serine/threonine-protein kinase PknD [Rubripirellula amarantea]
MPNNNGDDMPNDGEDVNDGDDLDKTLPAIEKTTPDIGNSKTGELDATVVFPMPPNSELDQTVDVPPSILTSENIGATINPRELGPSEAKAWQSIVGSSEPSTTATTQLTFSENREDINKTKISETRVVRGKGLASSKPDDPPTSGMETADIGDMSRGSDSGMHIAQTSQAFDSSLMKQTPAIERTVSDKAFGRLRTCDVVDSRTSPQVNCDYQLVKKLGQGGMGDVYVARQKSLDRLLALKLIKPIVGDRKKRLEQTGRLEEVESERRQQFLSEAEVTGDLDHPNIVPIHDIAVTTNGELFYSMKKVDGIPWSEKIQSFDLAHNIEVLLKVCDAIALAHHRGVVHRDIKPENIMLGDYGVVMVMDWGLALPTSSYPKERQESILATSGLGGTPAFMAPEMAIGPLTKIGPAADIYLLGATLFMVITGKPPHHAANVTECLHAVRSNAIREVAPDKRGELLDIALKAMATDPSDRYAGVLEFQQAIRDYLEHADSIRRSREARLLLLAASENGSYETFSRATFKFQEAIESWPGNQDAIEGLADAKLMHAEAAHSKGDFDLGFSLVDAENESHGPIIKKLQEGVWQRESRVTRLKLMRRVAAAMLIFILVGGTFSWLKIRSEKQNAIAARDQEKVAKDAALEARDREESAKRDAIKARDREVEATKEAVLAKQNAEQAEQSARMSAEQERLAKEDAVAQKRRAEILAESEKEARRTADEEKQRAIAAKALAEKSEQRASYEEYISKIALAKASLERNDTANARKILDSLRDSQHANGWEWRWLWKQTSGAESEFDTHSGVKKSSISKDGRAVAILDDNGRVFVIEPSKSIDGQQRKRFIPIPADLIGKATCVAIAKRSNMVAVGFDDGTVLISDGQEQQTFSSHSDRVNDLQWLGNDVLVSSSSDRTVRIFDNRRGIELTEEKALWHLSSVDSLAVTGDSEQAMIAAVMSSESAGRVAVWQVTLTTPLKFEQQGVFAGHDHPIAAITIRDDGTLAASGDIDGELLLWDPRKLTNTKYEDAVQRAVSAMTDEKPRAKQRRTESERGTRLSDPQIERSSSFVSTIAPSAADPSDSKLAHRDTIQTLDFDDSGTKLLSGSDDFTMKSWDVAAGKLLTKYRGHGGWVMSAAFREDDPERIMSVSADGNVLDWNAKTYVSDSVAQTLVQETDGDAADQSRTKPAHAFPISSASFSPDGRRIVTASVDHSAKILSIDPTTLAFFDEIELKDQTLSEGTSFVAMSMQTNRAASALFIGSADATVRIWDVAKGVQKSEIRGTGLNGTIAVSRSGNLLLTGSSSPDFKTILWQVDPTGAVKPRRLARMVGHDQAVTAMDISPDESRLFTIDSIGFGILWDARTGKAIGKPYENIRGFRASTATFSPSGKQIWIGGDDGQLTEIDLQTKQTLRRLDHDGGLRDVHFDAEHSYAVTVSELSTLTARTSVATLWNLRTGNSVELDRAVDAIEGDQGQSKRIMAARMAPDASTVVVSRRETSGQSSLSVWQDIASITSTTRPQRVLGLPKQLQTTQAMVLPNQGQCITMNKSGAFRWELDTGKLVRSYREHAALTHACFSPDGKYVATGSRSVKIWDATNGKAVAKIESPHLGPVRTLSFLAQPTRENTIAYDLVTGGDDGVARQWKVTPTMGTTQPVRQWLANNNGAVRAVATSPSGQRLLIAGDNGLAQVIDTDDSSIQWRIDLNQTDGTEESPADFMCGAFSDDEQFVVLGGSDNLVRMYAINDHNQNGDDSLRQLTSVPIEFSGHAGNIDDVKILGTIDSGLRVFSASSDDSARIWDSMIRLVNGKAEVTSNEGREVLSLQKHRGDVTAIDVTDDGRLMMTAGRDGQVILWPATAPENLFEAVP